MANDDPVGILVVGLSSELVAPLPVDDGAHVVTMTVGVSAQVRQSDAMIVLLQDAGTAVEVGVSYDNIGQVAGLEQLVTVAVVKIVIVLRDNGEHVERVKVIVLT